MRILLPTDGSEYSKTAAGFIRRLGLGPGDRLYVMHVLKEFLLPDEVDPARDFIKAGQQGAREMLREFMAENVPAGVQAEPVVREGEPWREIAEGAEELKADLVVMGHQGLSAVREYLLGGTALKVVRHSGASCLVVRRPLPEGRPARVLYCADGSVSAGHARDLLMDMPLAADTVVDVVAVVDMDVTSLPEKFYPDEDVSKMMAELRSHYQTAAQKTLDVECARLGRRFSAVSGQIRFGAPDDEIIKAAASFGSDLVVMGCRAMKGLSGIIVGSESLRVLRHTATNVLVAKTAGC